MKKYICGVVTGVVIASIIGVGAADRLCLDIKNYPHLHFHR